MIDVWFEIVMIFLLIHFWKACILLLLLLNDKTERVWTPTIIFVLCEFIFCYIYIYLYIVILFVRVVVWVWGFHLWDDVVMVRFRLWDGEVWDNGSFVRWWGMWSCFICEMVRYVIMVYLWDGEVCGYVPSMRWWGMWLWSICEMMRSVVMFHLWDGEV